jgi:hypothetical protein
VCVNGGMLDQYDGLEKEGGKMEERRVRNEGCFIISTPYFLRLPSNSK